jgi:hypothetical protein
MQSLDVIPQLANVSLYRGELAGVESDLGLETSDILLLAGECGPHLVYLPLSLCQVRIAPNVLRVHFTLEI